MIILLSILYFILFAFFAYLQTPFLFGADSAEYSTIAATWSIPHPPGYPLYSLMANLLNTLIPFSTPTWKAGLLSSIPTVATSFLLFLILRRALKDQYIALLCALLYLFLFPVWLYALVPEVFALNNFIIALITYLVLRYNDKQRSLVGAAIFLTIGLAIAHHHTFVLFIPGWFLLLKPTLRRKFILKDKLKHIGALLLGTSFYLYAPIASSFNPPIDWENAKTIDGFVRLITRSSYGTFSAYADASPDIGTQVYDFLSFFILMLQDFKVLGFVITVIGLIYTIRTRSELRGFMLATLCIHLFFLFYSNFKIYQMFSVGVYERYFVFIYLNIILLFAHGCVAIKQGLYMVRDRYIKNAVLKKILTASVYVFILIFVSIVFRSNMHSILALRTNDRFEKYATDVLTSIPKNAIVYMKGDTPYFTTEYMYSVEKMRPDLKFIKILFLERDYYAAEIKRKYPDVYIPQYYNNAEKFYEEFFVINGKKHEIYMEAPYRTGTWQPYGLVWKYYPDAEAARSANADLIKINDQLWGAYQKLALKEHDKNVLFIAHLKELYERSLVAFLDFLIANQQYEKVLAYLLQYADIISGDNVDLIFAKSYLIQGDCKKLKPYAQKFIDKNMYTLSHLQLQLTLKYYGVCDKENPKAYEYLELYQKIKNAGFNL